MADLNIDEWWNDPINFQFDNYWFCTIIDGTNNSNDCRASNFFKNLNGNFDNYIKSFKIPQTTIKFEKTDFNLLNIDSFETYGSINLEFYDDNDGTALAFFNAWKGCIYDEEKHCYKKNWRLQNKNFIIYQIQIKKSNSKSYKSSREIKIINTFEVKNAYISNVDDISFDEGNGSEIKTYSANLECESCKTTRGQN